LGLSLYHNFYRIKVSWIHYTILKHKDLVRIFFSKNNDTITLEDSEKFETISIESKIREGVFHQVVKNKETGKAVSCSCKCWSKGNKACFGMKSIGI